MNKRYFLLILIFVLLINNKGFCNILTLEDCISTALKNNLEIKEKERNLKYSKYDLKEAKAGYYPKLDFIKSYTSSKFVTYTPTYTFEAIPTVPPQYKLTEGEVARKDIMKDSYKMGISLKQLVYDSGRTKNLVETRKENLNLAYLEYQRIKQEITFKVKENYFQGLIAKNLVNLGEENLKLFKNYLQMIIAREKQGLAIYQERLKIESEITQQELNLINARNSYQLALTLLNSILGRDLSSQIELKDYETENVFDLSYEDCLNIAYNNRLEVQQIKSQISSSFSLFKMLKAEKYPLLTLTGNYDYSDEKYPPKENTYNIGLLFAYPLYDGGSRNAKIDSAKTQIELKKIQEEKMKQAIALEVKENYQNLVSLKEKIRVVEQYLKQTEENFKMTDKRYTLGIANFIELIESENKVIHAKTNYLQAKYNFYISWAKLEKVIGRNL